MLFVQIDGVAMGSPLAPILADIFMNIILEKNINKTIRTDSNVIFMGDNKQFVLQFFTRYVDDILAAVTDPQTAREFFIFLNSLHPNIQFTMEEEEDCTLPFLDVRLTRENHTLTTEVYRKSTHSGVYTHFTSFIPFHFKSQLISTLLHRAYQICSSYELLHREYERIRVMLMNNGYTSDYILSAIERFMLKKYTKYPPVVGPQPKELYLRVPYLKDATFKLDKTITSCLSQIRCGSLRVKLFYKYHRVSDRLKFKDRSSTVNNAIYHLE